MLASSNKELKNWHVVKVRLSTLEPYIQSAPEHLTVFEIK